MTVQQLSEILKGYNPRAEIHVTGLYGSEEPIDQVYIDTKHVHCSQCGNERDVDIVYIQTSLMTG